MKMIETTKMINAIKENAEYAGSFISTYSANKAFKLIGTLSISVESQKVALQFFNDKFLPDYLYPNKRLLKKEDKLRQFYSLLANLKLSSAFLPVRISLHTNRYTNHFFYSEFIIDLVHWLTVNRYLYTLSGYQFDPSLPGRQTRICPSKKLKIELLKDIELINIPTRNNLVILRDVKDKKELPYKDNKFTRNLKERLYDINLVNSRHRVELEDFPERKFLVTDLHCVFNNKSFIANGRFYTGRHGYQNIRREERDYILIDGEQTVELDFKGLHPRLLYVLKGIQYNDDPYRAVMDDDEFRPILKTLLLALINSDSRAAAIKVGNYRLLDKRKLRRYLKNNNLRIRDIIEMFKIAHQPIAEYFLTQQGFCLMNIDSQIAIQVLEHFTFKGEACLTIHDSFIVKWSNEDELRNAMKVAYEDISEKYSPTHQRFFCGISKK